MSKEVVGTNCIIDEIVGQGLCSGCGVCAGVCPRGALDMRFNASGDLVPYPVGSACQGCGICLKVCPFWRRNMDLPALNAQLFGAQGGHGTCYDPTAGHYTACYVGFSLVDQHRENGASGGLVTWSLEKLLEAGEVDRVAVVRRTFSGERRFSFASCSDVRQIRAAAGSRYYPVDISEPLGQALQGPPLRWALVGLPCLVHGVRLAMRAIPELGHRIRYLLALTCGMLPNSYYTEFMVRSSGIRQDNVGEINYRVWHPLRKASDFGFYATNTAGLRGREIRYHGFSFYLLDSGFFRVNACNFCSDVFGDAADASFMDAWLPECNSDPRGTSLTIVRSPRFDDLFGEGRRRGELELSPVSVERAIESQVGGLRRKRNVLSPRLHWANARGIFPPRHHVHPQAGGPLFALTWWMERNVQTASKSAWARWGRRFGPMGFWLRMGHWAVLTRAVLTARRVAVKARRLTAKMRNMMTSRGHP